MTVAFKKLKILKGLSRSNVQYSIYIDYVYYITILVCNLKKETKKMYTVNVFDQIRDNS